MKALTLGSLFDGSGGFPLGGILSGVRPVWAAEIEPYPIAVTHARMPAVKHIGNVCAANGGQLEPVDIITFGSPCTNMSVAGKREGLQGKQSSLFYEAIRIIKEMREQTNEKYPRFILWENVPGAFNTNKGDDFRSVLEAIVQICEPYIQMPPANGGRWPYSDIIVGNGWSVAYRTIDAQYFGVAQRRKRIYLVADFRSERAGDILFERQGMRRDYTTCAGAMQGVAAEAAGSTSGTGEQSCELPVICLNEQGGQYINVSYNITGTLLAGMANKPPKVLQDRGYCLAGNIIDRKPENGGNGCGYQEELCYTLNTVDRHVVCEDVDNHSQVVGALCAGDAKGVGNQMVNQGKCIVTNKRRVRRLTPRECCRLQGFPPEWGALPERTTFCHEEIAFWTLVRNEYAKVNGRQPRQYTEAQLVAWYNKLHSDSAEYKMWGNGVALPCVRYVIQGIVEVAMCTT